MNGLEKMINASGEMLFSYPSFSAADRAKRLVKKTLFHQKMAPLDAFSWPNAMLGDGLLTAFAATGNRQALLDCATYLDRWEKKECRIYYVDNIMNAALALWVEGLLEDPQILEGNGEQEERGDKGSGAPLATQACKGPAPGSGKAARNGYGARKRPAKGSCPTGPSFRIGPLSIPSAWSVLFCAVTARKRGICSFCVSGSGRYSFSWNGEWMRTPACPIMATMKKPA